MYRYKTQLTSVAARASKSSPIRTFMRESREEGKNKNEKKRIVFRFLRVPLLVPLFGGNVISFIIKAMSSMQPVY